MPVPWVVLVHSPLVGPLTWRGVAAELAAAGYRTVVADLTGVTNQPPLPDRSRVAPTTGTYDAVAIAVADQVRAAAGDDPTVLVAHSGAGAHLPAIATRLGTTTMLVFVDAGLPRPGRSWVQDAPAELVEHLASLVDTAGVLPPWHEWFSADAIASALPDDAQRAAFEAEVPRLPWTYFSEPAPPAGWPGPIAYLLLSEGYRAEAEAARAAGARIAQRLTDHLAPATRPGEVATALRELLLPPAPSRLPFGAVAQAYEDVRPGYPDELVDAILAYAGRPPTIVEVGAGTGKATAAFVARGIEVTCVEPDTGMAAFLRRRFGDHGPVTVVPARFEQWSPPMGGVPLIVFALSWHWLDPATRVRDLRAALPAGGAVALLHYVNGFADAAVQVRLDAIYARLAPELATPAQGHIGLEDHLAGLVGPFDDLHRLEVTSDRWHPTGRYLQLLGTFSDHLGLSADRRRALHDAIAAAIEADGGVTVRLTTNLVLARAV